MTEKWDPGTDQRLLQLLTITDPDAMPIELRALPRRQ